MKLANIWWVGSDEYVCASVADYGLPVPQKICGVPFSKLLQLAREHRLLIEWVSRRGFMIYRIGASEDGISLMGGDPEWDAPAKLGAIYLNFELPITGAALEASNAAEAAGFARSLLFSRYCVYKNFLA
jgi:hypothetical protein